MAAYRWRRVRNAIGISLTGDAGILRGLKAYRAAQECRQAVGKNPTHRGIIYFFSSMAGQAQTWPAECYRCQMQYRQVITTSAKWHIVGNFALKSRCGKWFGQKSKPVEKVPIHDYVCDKCLMSQKRSKTELKVVDGRIVF